MDAAETDDDELARRAREARLNTIQNSRISRSRETTPKKRSPAAGRWATKPSPATQPTKSHTGAAVAPSTPSPGRKSASSLSASPPATAITATTPPESAQPSGDSGGGERVNNNSADDIDDGDVVEPPTVPEPSVRREPSITVGAVTSGITKPNVDGDDDGDVEEPPTVPEPTVRREPSIAVALPGSAGPVVDGGGDNDDDEYADIEEPPTVAEPTQRREPSVTVDADSGDILSVLLESDDYDVDEMGDAGAGSAGAGSAGAARAQLNAGDGADDEAITPAFPRTPRGRKFLEKLMRDPTIIAHSVAKSPAASPMRRLASGNKFGQEGRGAASPESPAAASSPRRRASPPPAALVEGKTPDPRRDRVGGDDELDDDEAKSPAPDSSSAVPAAQATTNGRPPLGTSPQPGSFRQPPLTLFSGRKSQMPPGTYSRIFSASVAGTFILEETPLHTFIVGAVLERRVASKVDIGDLLVSCGGHPLEEGMTLADVTVMLDEQTPPVEITFRKPTDAERALMENVHTEAPPHHTPTERFNRWMAKRFSPQKPPSVPFVSPEPVAAMAGGGAGPGAQAATASATAAHLGRFQTTQGYLEKKGTASVRYKTVYFVLRGHALCYWHNYDEFNEGADPVGTYDLAHLREDDPVHLESRTLVLYFRHRKRRRLKATDQRHAIGWGNAICRAIGRAVADEFLDSVVSRPNVFDSPSITRGAAATPATTTRPAAGGGGGGGGGSGNAAPGEVGKSATAAAGPRGGEAADTGRQEEHPATLYLPMVALGGNSPLFKEVEAGFPPGGIGVPRRRYVCVAGAGAGPVGYQRTAAHGVEHAYAKLAGPADGDTVEASGPLVVAAGAGGEGGSGGRGSLRWIPVDRTAAEEHFLTDGVSVTSEKLARAARGAGDPEDEPDTPEDFAAVPGGEAGGTCRGGGSGVERQLDFAAADASGLARVASANMSDGDTRECLTRVLATTDEDMPVDSDAAHCARAEFVATYLGLVPSSADDEVAFAADNAAAANDAATADGDDSKTTSGDSKTTGGDSKATGGGASAPASHGGTAAPAAAAWVSAAAAAATADDKAATRLAEMLAEKEAALAAAEAALVAARRELTEVQTSTRAQSAQQASKAAAALARARSELQVQLDAERGEAAVRAAALEAELEAERARRDAALRRVALEKERRRVAAEGPRLVRCDVRRRGGVLDGGGFGVEFVVVDRADANPERRQLVELLQPCFARDVFPFIGAPAEPFLMVSAVPAEERQGLAEPGNGHRRGARGRTQHGGADAPASSAAAATAPGAVELLRLGDVVVTANGEPARYPQELALAAFGRQTLSLAVIRLLHAPDNVNDDEDEEEEDEHEDEEEEDGEEEEEPDDHHHAHMQLHGADHPQPRGSGGGGVDDRQQQQQQQSAARREGEAKVKGADEECLTGDPLALLLAQVRHRAQVEAGRPADK